LPPGAIGFALLGAGAGAALHAEALATLPGVRLAVVADPDVARARALAARHGVPALDDPHAALDREDVHAACVVAPNHQHAALAAAAAARGVAVLVEKPLGRDAREARVVVDACAAGGVPLGLVLQNRFAPEAVTLRAVLREGRLGRIVGATLWVRDHRDARYFAAGPWRGTPGTSGGGVLRIQAIHLLDLLDWLLGPLAVVGARLDTRAHAVTVEDVLSATLALGDGAPAALFATTGAPIAFPARLDVLGTDGLAVLWEAAGAVRAWHGPPGPDARAAIAALEAAMAARLGRPWPEGITADLHRALLADFAASLRAGRPPTVDGRAALRIQGLIDAVYLAARAGAAPPPPA